MQPISLLSYTGQTGQLRPGPMYPPVVPGRLHPVVNYPLGQYNVRSRLAEDLSWPWMLARAGIAGVVGYLADKYVWRGTWIARETPDDMAVEAFMYMLMFDFGRRFTERRVVVIEP